jgi:GNAT superfamily N-acetyltransferase
MDRMEAIQAANLFAWGTNAMDIRRIVASDTVMLRNAVLPPGLPPDRSIYPGDDARDTLHLGVFLDTTLVAVATLCREPLPDNNITTSWRLRGMAALPECRGRGFGRQLVERCLRYAVDQEGTLVWCTSRISTVPFYRALGFREYGDAFSLPQYSDALYVHMQHPLP